MRIAAGVILIIAAIFNVIAGAGYVVGGGVVAVGGAVLDEAGKQMSAELAKTGDATSDEAKKAQEELGKVTSVAKAGGTGLLVFGFFLWLMFVLQIVGSVLLFLAKAKGFCMVVGVLSILAEIGGVVLIAFGWTNLFGLVGGLLAIFGAMSIGKGTAAPAAPAA